MVTCPLCDSAIDVEEEEVDEGDSLSCDECGGDLKVVGKDPLELESTDELDEEEEEEGSLADPSEDEEEDWK